MSPENINFAEEKKFMHRIRVKESVNKQSIIFLWYQEKPKFLKKDFLFSYSVFKKVVKNIQ